MMSGHRVDCDGVAYDRSGVKYGCDGRGGLFVSAACSGDGRPMLAEGTAGEEWASWDGGRSWHVLTCGYCRQSACRTECLLAWEIRMAVGRGAVDPSTWNAETWADWGRLLGRDLLPVGRDEIGRTLPPVDGDCEVV